MSQQLLSQEQQAIRSAQVAPPGNGQIRPEAAPKIVLTGITGLRNRGVEALVMATIDQLRAQWPDAHIAVVTRSPEYDVLRLNGRHVAVVGNSFHEAPPSWFRKFGRTIKSTLRGGSLPSDGAERILQEASLVIALGGDVFSSDYGSLEAHLRPLQYALDHKVPVTMLGHSVGPFKSAAEASQWLSVAKQCCVVTVRETLSFEYVLQELKLPAKLLARTVDPAVLLQPAEAPAVSSLLQAYGILPAATLATVAPSQGIVEYARLDAQRHVESWLAVVRELLDNCVDEVLIVPHVQETYVANDDRIIAAEIHRRLDFDRRVHVAGADHTAAEFKGLIAAGELIVAERMHAAIAALSSGKPALLVGYSAKAKGIVNDLFTESGLTDSTLISIQNFLDSAKAVAAVRSAWSQRMAASGVLAAQLPAMREGASKNFSLLIGHLKSTQS